VTSLLPDGPLRFAMACDGDIVALVRDTFAAAWNVTLASDMALVWTAKLPRPLDVSAVQLVTEPRMSRATGCLRALPVDHGSITIPLQGGSSMKVSLSNGK
jgi:hypothetical protein